jgi:hypothetical protein
MKVAIASRNKVEEARIDKQLKRSSHEEFIGWRSSPFHEGIHY